MAVTTEEAQLVWCPSRCGNRLLDHDEDVGFPCPQCRRPMVAEKPAIYDERAPQRVLDGDGDLVLGDGWRFNPEESE